VGEVFAGRYEFVDLLGQGGMGTVWRVWDLREREYRAAKVLRQSDSPSLLRFVRETGTRIDHEHVVAPTGWSAEDDRVLFTMPLVAGGSLATLLADYGALPGEWVKELTLQLLEALSAVHGAGLVHRDIKPANLLLDATGTRTPRLRLSDFGIAASMDEPRLTRASEIVHTPGYAAPEAGAEPDPRQDLYSVGIVMREMLTGIPPGKSSVGEGPFAAFVSRLTAGIPADRPADAGMARAELAGIEVPPDQAEEPIEIFDQLPPLPGGWGSEGPTRERRASRSATPSRTARLRIAATALAVVGAACVAAAFLIAF
jgi:serine/threonine-protein kinase